MAKRKHTPIVSKKQRGFFGAELRRKRRGKKGKTKMSKATLARHLRESKGKKLPLRSKGKKRRGRKWYKAQYRKSRGRRRRS